MGLGQVRSLQAPLLGQARRQGLGHLGGPTELLPHHPLGCGFLAVPRLEQLLRQALEGLEVGGGVDGAVHPLDFEFLAEAEAERFGHGDVRGAVISQHYKVFHLRS